MVQLSYPYKTTGKIRALNICTFVSKVVTLFFYTLSRFVMIIHLEPEILECELKWALGSITMNKASGGDGIPVE